MTYGFRRAKVDCFELEEFIGMNSSLRIRTFLPDEWESYRDLRLRALADSPQAFGRTLAEEEARTPEEWSQRLSASATSPWWLCLIATMDVSNENRSVGIAFAQQLEESPDVAHLYSMWVDPIARGNGIGRRLVDAILNWARRRDVRQVVLQVTEGNQAAINLYARCGFLLTHETSPLRPGSQLMTHTMEIRL